MPEASKKIEFVFLYELYRVGGDCSFEQIIDSTYRHKSTISNVISRLEEEGLVISYSDSNAKIKKRVKILPKAEQIVKLGLDKSKDWTDILVQNLNEEEKSRVMDYLHRINKNLKNYDQNNYNPYPEIQSISYLASYIKKRIHHIAFCFDHRDLELNQIYILIHLAYCEGFCTYKELESAVTVAQSVIVRQMKKLTDAGYVYSRTDEKDHRVKIGILTEKGSVVGEELLRVYLEAEELSIDGFSGEEYQDFINILEKILESIKI
ncbi:MAG: MarR family winged helix-turn-helix transcriptional regulator [Eubacteriales bacterium]|nr:MarR family winged helix-turn-helix transcriptional regulator [Eubacteriales bacterium]